MSVNNSQAYLVDPSRPNATPTPIDGGGLGIATLLFGILLEMRVANYYNYCNASGFPVPADDTPDSVRNSILADTSFVVFK